MPRHLSGSTARRSSGGRASASYGQSSPRAKVSLLAERVLHVVAGLLEVCLRLVGFSLGLHALVVRRVAGLLLHLALGLFGRVLCLVSDTHPGHLHRCLRLMPVCAYPATALR